MTPRQLQEATEGGCPSYNLPAVVRKPGNLYWGLKPPSPACRGEIWIKMHYQFPMEGACKEIHSTQNERRPRGHRGDCQP